MQNYYGKHIYVDKGVYTHHGLGIGNRKVIHYAGFSEAWELGPVEIVSIDDFARGAELKIKPYDNRRFSPKDAIKRAFSRLGEDGYTLWGNNCEHFVEWAITGEQNSKQVQKAGFLLGAITVLLGIASYATALVIKEEEINNKSLIMDEN